MPWYKLELKGGKGHTNQEVKYIWSDFKWNAIEKECQWDSWASQFGYERKWDGHVTYMKHLPAEIRKQKIKEYETQIEEANRMITLILE